MSSLRNSVKRRAHKERSQPGERRGFGFLEKHKDYVRRARNFHQKEKAIRVLREKAANRNPDEFYFGMVNARTEDGVHIQKHDGPEYTHEEILLMKTQDMGYLMNKVQSEIQKIEKLKSSLHFLDKDKLQEKNHHVRFADDKEEAKELEEYLELEANDTPIKKLPKKLEKKKEAAYNELAERMLRVKSMKKVIAELSLKKQLMRNGKVKKFRKGGSVVYKWANERSK